MSNHVSCDRCTARAVVTLTTEAGGYLSFCGHHQRGIEPHEGSFLSAVPPTNEPSPAAVAAAVDAFLVEAVGHCEVTA